MPKYKYKAINESGKTVYSRLDAANASDLELRIDRMGLELINFKEVKTGGLYITRRRITRQDLITFCYHLEQLTRAGIPLIDGLSDLRDSVENPRFREIISAMIESIEGGRTLSQSMADFPRLFDDVFINLIRVGEESGQLPEVLKNMTDSLKWQDELAAQTKKVLMYPAFVGLVVVGVIFFLMIYLVPQLVSFIKNMGEEIPLHTAVLIAVSNFFQNYWYAILATPFAFFALLIYAMHVSEKVRYKVDEYKLQLWIIGPILRKIILTRFANYFSLLYASGVAILTSLKISEEIVGNLAVAAALKNVRQQIADGNSISASMENVALFPPLVLRMLKVGESTGDLDSALSNVSYFYSREVKESIEKVQAMIEPLLTIVLGTLLGWVMLSVLGPIYDIIGKIKT
jgi:type IV pilus assembly protein PilC